MLSGRVRWSAFPQARAGKGGRTGILALGVFIVHDLGVAVLFCIVTMLGWGSWANTQKLAGKDRWPFELFYWDYAIGVFAFSLVFAFTLGSVGGAGAPFVANMSGASSAATWIAISSGVLFNISNILLVV